MDIIQVITKELNVEKWQVEAAVKLIDEGCTIPFISLLFDTSKYLILFFFQITKIGQSFMKSTKLFII